LPAKILARRCAISFSIDYPSAKGQPSFRQFPIDIGQPGRLQTIDDRCSRNNVAALAPHDLFEQAVAIRGAGQSRRIRTATESGETSIGHQRSARIGRSMARNC